MNSLLPSVICLFGLVALTHAQVIFLNPGNESHLEIELSANNKTEVRFKDLTGDIAFLIVQAHAYLYNVTISYKPDLILGSFTTGTNVGLVLEKTAGALSTLPVYVSNSNDVPVQILLVLTVYDSNAPIPGGCNMEQPIKTAPFLPTTFTQNVLMVEYPLGAWARNIVPATCDRASLQYDIYEYYLPERDTSAKTAFESLRLMTDIKSIEQNGRKVVFSGTPPTNVKFSNYVGTGRIVVVIARSLISSAAYVPSLTWGCNFFSVDETDTCIVLGTAGSKMLVAFMLFVGLFLVFFGHRFYKTQLFLLGFSFGALLFYVILLTFVEVTPTVSAMTAVVVGAIGGALWLTFWANCLKAPLVPIFLAATMLGVLFSSTLAYTPLADYPILKQDATFWLAFVCLVLVIPLVVISFDRLTNILWCTFVGGYIFLVPIDHYFGSHLKFIILNVLRRATDGEFSTAIIDPPYQTTDIILTVVYFVLVAAGTSFQLWREKNQPPFPHPPERHWPEIRRRRPTTAATDANPTEATHLLSS